MADDNLNPPALVEKTDDGDFLRMVAEAALLRTPTWRPYLVPRATRSAAEPIPRHRECLVGAPRARAKRGDPPTREHASKSRSRGGWLPLAADPP